MARRYVRDSGGRFASKGGGGKRKGKLSKSTKGRGAKAAYKSAKSGVRFEKRVAAEGGGKRGIKKAQKRLSETTSRLRPSRSKGEKAVVNRRKPARVAARKAQESQFVSAGKKAVRKGPGASMRKAAVTGKTHKAKPNAAKAKYKAATSKLRKANRDFKKADRSSRRAGRKASKGNWKPELTDKAIIAGAKRESAIGTRAAARGRVTRLTNKYTRKGAAQSKTSVKRVNSQAAANAYRLSRESRKRRNSRKRR